MKKITLVCIVALGYNLNAQIYTSKKCNVKFFSETKMENIDAENKVTRPILNTKDGHFIVQIFHTGFIFKSAFMQEHYNENYMESEKYPDAKFDGLLVEKIDYTKDGTYTVSIAGKLSMHGVELPRTISGTIVIKGEVITMDSKFDIKVADYKIKVPSLYVEKIAENIQVTFHSEMTPMKK